MAQDPKGGEQPAIEHQINIELGEQEAQGIYSNLVIISHSVAEFVLDFTRVLPGLPRARVHARIIMTPQHAKLLWIALGENLRKYEQQYGEIHVEPTAPVPSGGAFRVH